MCIKLKRLQEGRGIEVVAGRLFTGADWVKSATTLSKLSKPPAYIIFNLTKTRCFGFTGADILRVFEIAGPVLVNTRMKHIDIYPSREHMDDMTDMVTTLVKEPHLDMEDHYGLVMDFPEAMRWLANQGAFED